MRTRALEVPVRDLPEISFDTAEFFGINAEELVGDDRSARQQVAGRLRRETTGVIVPSAALPGTRNVVLFAPRVAAPYLTEPVSIFDIPASITAEAGRPLLTLLSTVRFTGDSHPALEAWKQGTTFEFTEPDWST